ncbi:MAG: malonate decarboxylase subunit alpha [Erysipelotrichaceae bacterium]|nr:malonate decarboxylase subunit alpha [Erysipelotrichaceae bacterium]
MNWETQKQSKQERLAQCTFADGKVVATEDIVRLLEATIRPYDRVVLEGCNQKQAAFLAASLTKVSPDKVNHLNMIIPSISRDEHLQLFEEGIAEEVNFAFAGVQSVQLSQMLAAHKLKIGAIHTYLELYSRMYVDLTPNVCLIAADKADRNGNLYTGFNTEDTPMITEAAAFKNGIVIAQVNDIVDTEDLPRVDIPSDWVDFIVKADKPYPMVPLFTRDPRKIQDAHVLQGMMTIKGIYAKHEVKSLNHGIGFNGCAIELLLPTYGNELGLKGKICTNWVLNPHPTLIPAIEDGWVKSICAFGGEVGMEKYTRARSDIFFTGKDGSLRSNRAYAQCAGLYGMDLFLGGTLQMDYDANSSTVTNGRLSGFGGAPNMGNSTGGRRHTTKAWKDMAPGNGSLVSGRKLVVQMVKSSSKFGPAFVPELDAVKIGKDAGMDAVPVMMYGEDVTHVVTEQGIAYLYTAQNRAERAKLMGAVAQGTPLGETVSASELETLRRQGKVALPEDLDIDPKRATKDLLAAKSLEEIAEISGGLYEIPEKLKYKPEENK